jgi:ketosteroid isomerase-like protein
MPFLTAALIVAPAVAVSPAGVSPRQALEELATAERSFSERARTHADPIAGFAEMLAPDVIWPSQRLGLVRGREAVLAMMRADPNYGHAASWRPVRIGVSADGTHGFSYGYLEMAGGDPARRGRRYLAYWVRRPEGWRVAAYRQAIRRAGETLLEPVAPSTPRMAAAIRWNDLAHAPSLIAAEQAFSDRAQQVGLRAAFTEFGRPDAINMGSTAGFVVGSEAIGRALFDERTSSPVHWKADHVLVAPSGELGITFGFVRSHAPGPDGQPAQFPFFTIWRRDGYDLPWRYIAE